MALHPSDLEHMTFPTVRRGFDPVAVRSYLYSLADTIRRDARQTNPANQPSTAAARNDAQAILLAAQETAESIRAEARSQAERIRNEALVSASQPSAHQPRAHQPRAHQPRAHQPSAHQPVDAERRLQSKVRQLEALRAEVERLHEESGEAVRIASNERRAAERVRAESIDEIARLRAELNALQTQAGSANVASTGMRVQVPGSVDHRSQADTTLDLGKNRATRIDTHDIAVLDSSVPGPPTPLSDAVKSAVGKAMKR